MKIIFLIALIFSLCSAQLQFCEKNDDCVGGLVCEQQICQLCDKSGCRVIGAFFNRHRRDDLSQLKNVGRAKKDADDQPKPRFFRKTRFANKDYLKNQ